MTFVSLTFLIFTPLVFVVYWLAERRRLQNAVLILASYLFYGWWDYRFCGLMLVSSLVDYGLGLAMGSVANQRGRRWLLGVSLLANLSLLGTFKYFNFFAENLALLAGQCGWQLNWGTLEIILPVGISFYTFQTLSYTIDIYRKKLTPTRNLIDYLAFVSFFPQLVAGPIERAQHLLPQFASRRTFKLEEATDGCRQILWGFFKKLVIADRLALFVDAVYASPASEAGPTLMLATVGFAIQIYCDFSAYSDIAIGTARLFDIRLRRNFAYPFFSQSTTELWQRWHISLSTWLRDYVCIPLDGRRKSPLRRLASVLATFLVCGLWHGAAWHFVAWGGLNGSVVAGEMRTKRNRVRTTVPGGEDLLPPPRVLLRMLTTFGIFCATVLFFRASTIGDAVLICQRIWSDALSPAAYAGLGQLQPGTTSVTTTFMLVAGLLIVEWIQRRHDHPLIFEGLPRTGRWALYTALIWGGLCWMPTEPTSPFIYFIF